ncbi:MAG: YgiQ family radical SAM protein [Fusobacteriia bacterium 4572_132]|nr:MAG: YgiQ family radical SAM protein [Fusobacteriia bacterium 4572_132]
MFLPTTRKEMNKLGWEQCDVIVVSGDTYIDSSYIGAAVIGRVLENAGYKVGIIAQPDISTDEDIRRLGEPKLFWGVTAGAVDSMVANYTASKKKRRSDDFTPGGENTKRPNRASIAYTNLIKQNFKNTKPIVLGGIEASLRRVPHYDYWTNKIRKSILFNAKADILVYGMGEKTILDIAKKLKKGETTDNIRGICYISKEKRYNYIELPSFEEVKKDKLKFIDMFNVFYKNNDPKTAKGLIQLQDTRYLIQNPPQIYMSKEKLDEVYSYDYERDVHPYYKKDGDVKAMNTIKFSLTSHRGCYGECSFCAIAIHQGRTVRSRSQESIVNEAKKFTRDKRFKGNIMDVGGPTANMYEIECEKKLKYGACENKKCLYPEKCSELNVNHSKQIELLKKLDNIDGIKKVFVASGIRYDMIAKDKKYGEKYLNEIIGKHTSGQMKVAPEHTQDNVLAKMGKPGSKYLKDFKDKFYELNKKNGKKQFLTYYLIAAHPGCSEKDMKELKKYASAELKSNPEQVQIFTPTPSTYSTLMYYTEMDPFTKEKVFVEKDMGKKIKQKQIVVNKGRRKK